MRATIPAKIIREIPFPTPFCVILSPSHTMSIEPAVTVMIETIVNAAGPMASAPGMLRAYIDAASDWIAATRMVP